MFSIQFRVSKDNVFEYVGRVTTFADKFEDNLQLTSSLVSSTDSFCVVSFTHDLDWSWRKSKLFIDTLQQIARNNNLPVDVVGVLFNSSVN